MKSTKICQTNLLRQERQFGGSFPRAPSYSCVPGPAPIYIMEVTVQSIIEYKKQYKISQRK